MVEVRLIRWGTRWVRNEVPNLLAGGTKAILAANAHGVEAIAFNPGSGVKGLDAGNHKVYKGALDPISLTTSGSNIEYGTGKERGG